MEDNRRKAGGSRPEPIFGHSPTTHVSALDLRSSAGLLLPSLFLHTPRRARPSVRAPFNDDPRGARRVQAVGGSLTSNKASRCRNAADLRFIRIQLRRRALGAPFFNCCLPVARPLLISALPDDCSFELRKQRPPRCFQLNWLSLLDISFN